MYGRRGDPSVEEGEGIAMCKVAQGSRTLYCLITYVYPTLSARAVPQLKEFCETQCELIKSCREMMEKLSTKAELCCVVCVYWSVLLLGVGLVVARLS